MTIPAMKLFYSPASPFVRKVLITAAVKGLTSHIDAVASDATKGDPALNAANPMGRLPSLLVDGEPIHDSQVICEYLDSLAASPVLFPSAGMARWRCLTLASLADGILEAALLAVYERRYRPENMVVQSWLDRQWSKINASLAGLEASPPAWGQHPDYAHITLACALGYLDFRHGGTWRAGHPKLVAWLDQFALAVPSFEATRPKG
jgi:glutathione S-transferase